MYCVHMDAVQPLGCNKVCQHGMNSSLGTEAKAGDTPTPKGLGALEQRHSLRG